MTASQQRLLASIREPNVAGGRLLTSLLHQNGIPSALWGVNAGSHYGGGLCPLDIEIAINAADQKRVFDLLSSQGLTISTPNQYKETPILFEEWQRLAPSFSRFSDRRKARLITPIYELPATGDPLDDMLRPFIVVYSAEQIGLPSIAPPTPMSESGPREPYTMLSELNPDLALPDMGSENPQVVDCIVPSFASLLKSEMHVLLMHAEPHTPVWGQHMAKLSELVHSESCVGGPDNLEELISDTRLEGFIAWFRGSLSGAADYDNLDGLRATYREKQPPHKY
ncbi:hypothetical protein KVR01_005625 [Diaporthe batatas]|uniref:uncharacterized protein n=1 Tax=Diaporthe batatas TaxID=748121 RepID=UPI001D042017|nr:uncharacterized protein KVR01_005625 [Diaporthe batatas]KAG8165350.1 hypothetical protein KVR01_005625 [Diaporthe batatas]